MGVAPFSMTPSVPPAIFLLAKSVLPVPTTSGSTGLEDLVPLGRMLLAGDTINLLVEVQTVTHPLCDPYTIESTVKEGSYCTDWDG